MVVKLGGDENAFYKTKDGVCGQVAACPVEKVIDTGAGDSFAVGVVSAWLGVCR